MDGFQFDWTLNIGHLIILSTGLISGVGLFTRLMFNIRAMKSYLAHIEKTVDFRLEKVEGAIEKQTNILVNMARQDERLNAIDKRIDALVQRAA